MNFWSSLNVITSETSSTIIPSSVASTFELFATVPTLLYDHLPTQLYFTAHMCAPYPSKLNS